MYVTDLRCHYAAVGLPRIVPTQDILFSIPSCSHMARARFRIQHMLALTTVVAIAIAGWLALQHVTSTRTIVAVDLPGNKRVRLIQKLDGEPFNTSIYFDAGDDEDPITTITRMGTGTMRILI